MEPIKSKLKNGLRVITVPMPSLNSATLMLWTGVGSRHEDKKTNGISHFLEHMAFKGGQKYPSAKAVSETIDAIGGESNAGTSKHWTNYYIKTQTDKLETAFDVLSDMLIAPLLKEEEIEKEKGVIIEEIGVYEDMPRSKVLDYFENIIFDNSPLGMDIIGTRESVKSFSRADFVRYRNTHYHTDNMLLTIAGGVTEKEAVSLAEKYFSALKPASSTKNAKHKLVEIDYHSKNKLFLKSKKTEQTNFILGFPGLKLGDKNRYTESILETILGGGMSSRLFTEIREKRGLAYSVMATSDNFVDTGYFAVYAGTDPNKATEALKVTLNELHQISSNNHKISKTELEKSKGYLKGHFALSLESTKAQDYFYGNEEILLNKTRTPDEVFKGIDKVTIEDVNKLASSTFDIKKAHLAIIGPHKSNSKFKNILTTS